MKESEVQTIIIISNQLMIINNNKKVSNFTFQLELLHRFKITTLIIMKFSFLIFAFSLSILYFHKY